MVEETQVRLEPKSKCIESTKFRGKKKTFLTNSKNKQAFIYLLPHKLNIAGIQTSHAIGDADLLIVLTPVKCSMSRHTVLVGDDTDVLVLLCYHASPLSMPIYFHLRPKSHQETVSWDIHKLQNTLVQMYVKTFCSFMQLLDVTLRQKCMCLERVSA